ncbi:Uracil-DNA glycosylase [Nymphon striatum]|nr:Uracil-DNA glycosylase [Nymphon striatum]
MKKYVRVFTVSNALASKWILTCQFTVTLRLLGLIFGEDEMKRLEQFVERERILYNVYPPASHVWSWTWYTNYSNVKVIILGQDPYPKEGQAHGLSFSVPYNVSITRSLNNIFNELVDDIPGFQRPNHGNLSGWARQGVLLMNTVLTTREGAQNPHRNQGWEKLTDAVIQWFNTYGSNIVFIFWGNQAQKKMKLISLEKHLMLSAPHPSPLSASKGFFGCKHFSIANEYLKQHGNQPINWCHLPNTDEIDLQMTIQDCSNNPLTADNFSHPTDADGMDMASHDSYNHFTASSSHHLTDYSLL